MSGSKPKMKSTGKSSEMIARLREAGIEGERNLESALAQLSRKTSVVISPLKSAANVGKRRTSAHLTSSETDQGQRGKGKARLQKGRSTESSSAPTSAPENGSRAVPSTHASVKCIPEAPKKSLRSRSDVEFMELPLLKRSSSPKKGSAHKESHEVSSKKGSAHKESSETSSKKGSAHKESNETYPKKSSHTESRETSSMKSSAHKESHETSSKKGSAHKESHETPSKKSSAHKEICETPSKKSSALKESHETSSKKGSAHKESHETSSKKSSAHKEICETPSKKSSALKVSSETSKKGSVHKESHETSSEKSSSQKESSETSSKKCPPAKRRVVSSKKRTARHRSPDKPSQEHAPGNNNHSSSEKYSLLNDSPEEPSRKRQALDFSPNDSSPQLRHNTLFCSSARPPLRSTSTGEAHSSLVSEQIPGPSCIVGGHDERRLHDQVSSLSHIEDVGTEGLNNIVRPSSVRVRPTVRNRECVVLPVAVDNCPVREASTLKSLLQSEDYTLKLAAKTASESSSSHIKDLVSFSAGNPFPPLGLDISTAQNDVGVLRDVRKSPCPERDFPAKREISDVSKMLASELSDDVKRLVHNMPVFLEESFQYVAELFILCLNDLTAYDQRIMLAKSMKFHDDIVNVIIEERKNYAQKKFERVLTKYEALFDYFETRIFDALEWRVKSMCPNTTHEEFIAVVKDFVFYRCVGQGFEVKENKNLSTRQPKSDVCSSQKTSPDHCGFDLGCPSVSSTVQISLEKHEAVKIASKSKGHLEPLNEGESEHKTSSSFDDHLIEMPTSNRDARSTVQISLERHEAVKIASKSEGHLEEPLNEGESEHKTSSSFDDHLIEMPTSEENMQIEKKSGDCKLKKQFCVDPEAECDSPVVFTELESLSVSSRDESHFGAADLHSELQNKCGMSSPSLHEEPNVQVDKKVQDLHQVENCDQYQAHGYSEKQKTKDSQNSESEPQLQHQEQPNPQLMSSEVLIEDSAKSQNKLLDPNSIQHQEVQLSLHPQSQQQFQAFHDMEQISDSCAPLQPQAQPNAIQIVSQPQSLSQSQPEMLPQIQFIPQHINQNEIQMALPSQNMSQFHLMSPPPSDNVNQTFAQSEVVMQPPNPPQYVVQRHVQIQAPVENGNLLPVVSSSGTVHALMPPPLRPPAQTVVLTGMQPSVPVPAQNSVVPGEKKVVYFTPLVTLISPQENIETHMKVHMAARMQMEAQVKQQQQQQQQEQQN